MKRISHIIGLSAIALLTGCESSHLPGIPKGPPRYPREVAMAIDPVLQATARTEIQSALQFNDELIRAHAIETLAENNMTDCNAQIVDALSDRSSLVRKAAALAVGQLKVKEAKDHLAPLLNAEATARPADATHASQERIAAIFAMHQLGNTQYSHELEKTLFDQRTPVRGDSAFVLGLIGDKTAIPVLEIALHADKDPNIRLQAADSLWRLGDEQGEDALVEATISSYASDQMIALLALAGPRDTRVLGNVQGQFSNEYPEVRLVCARACGMLGNGDGYGVAMEGEKSVDPRQRALAAMVYGAIGRHDSQPRLKELLKDKDPDVRLAAAGALVAVAQHP